MPIRYCIRPVIAWSLRKAATVFGVSPLRVGGDGDDLQPLRLRAELRLRRFQVADDQRADVGAVGVDEGDQDCLALVLRRGRPAGRASPAASAPAPASAASLRPRIGAVVDGRLTLRHALLRAAAAAAAARGHADESDREEGGDRGEEAGVWSQAGHPAGWLLGREPNYAAEHTRRGSPGFEARRSAVRRDLRSLAIQATCSSRRAAL